MVFVRAGGGSARWGRGEEATAVLGRCGEGGGGGAGDGAGGDVVGRAEERAGADGALGM